MSKTRAPTKLWEEAPGVTSSKRVAALASIGTGCLMGLADVFLIVYNAVHSGKIEGASGMLGTSTAVIAVFMGGAWAAFSEARKSDALDSTVTTTTETNRGVSTTVVAPPP